MTINFQQVPYGLILMGKYTFGVDNKGFFLFNFGREGGMIKNVH